MNSEELVNTFFEIEPVDSDQFLKIKETLTRLGIAGKDPKDEKPTLWQSCHILHKRGRYFITHFKQMFLLDGRTRVTDFTDEDFDRTEFVVALLEEWKLLTAKLQVTKPKVELVIIPFAKKGNWVLKSKYTVGVKRV